MRALCGRTSSVQTGAPSAARVVRAQRTPAGSCVHSTGSRPPEPAGGGTMSPATTVRATHSGGWGGGGATHTRCTCHRLERRGAGHARRGALGPALVHARGGQRRTRRSHHARPAAAATAAATTTVVVVPAAPASTAARRGLLIHNRGGGGPGRRRHRDLAPDADALAQVIREATRGNEHAPTGVARRHVHGSPCRGHLRGSPCRGHLRGSGVRRAMRRGRRGCAARPSGATNSTPAARIRCGAVVVATLARRRRHRGPAPTLLLLLMAQCPERRLQLHAAVLARGRHGLLRPRRHLGRARCRRRRPARLRGARPAAPARRRTPLAQGSLVGDGATINHRCGRAAPRGTRGGWQ